MILTRTRLRSIGWAMILTICGALLLGLTFRVNAVKSQVRLTERKILAVRQEQMLLETEFETRANQHQLSSLNEVEFGYSAPTPRQYLEGERQLASLGKPRGVNAPAPIMVATAAGSAEPEFPAVANAFATRAMAAEPPRDAKGKLAKDADLGARLSRAERTTARLRESASE